jgi:cytochrome c peroxidase
MPRHVNHAAFLVALVALSGCTQPQQELTEEQELGKRLFNDQSLSTPPGQACVDCHSPAAGFADPLTELPVSRGARHGRFGSRNDLTAAYASFIGPLVLDTASGTYSGGLFWDGRANSLEEQAQGPPLNPLEMANPDAGAVVEQLRHGPHAAMFAKVYGTDALAEPDRAFDLMAKAIAAYERSRELNSFSSKYDAYLRGETALSTEEELGLRIFEDPTRGNCAACHPSRPGEDGAPPLFTDHTYDNLGIPPNPENPFYYLDRELNPAGPAFVDLGLGAVVHDQAQNGKFRVPTLRNVAITPPYMHNGIFRTLREVVVFYSTRDVGPWPAPEVPDNVNTDELGNLGLSQEGIDALVAFMQTLTDGYRPGGERHE